MPEQRKSIDETISIAILQLDVEALRKEVAANTAMTAELVEAWKAAGKLLAFVKYMSGFTTAIAAAWLILSHLFDKR